ncbi:TFPI1 inhibitor, partial [Rhinopomastus cyanomelas]|nr:TFPI1 inhibitor [Rhinopomastus cyanomelas]
HSVCAMKADEGPCKAVHMRYYFNMQSSSCEVFEYGGCHGNENNFLTLEECRKKCVAAGHSSVVLSQSAKALPQRPDICFHEKDPGICRGYFSRYFYNKETGLCELFKYGGCLGNQNNFRSMEECQATCEGSGNGELASSRPAVFPREPHSALRVSCMEQQRPPIPSLCLSPVDRGLCRAKELRFFYNYAARRCQPFSYSGCGGNENNFTSRKSCLRICKK